MIPELPVCLYSLLTGQVITACSSYSFSFICRCPKCHSLKKSKSSVSKTVSDSQEKRSRSSVYGHRTTTKEESRKSMPNLEHEVKNHHRHCCSSQDSLTTQSREYLQLVEDKGPMQERGMKQETRAELGELSSELDLLSSCLEVSTECAFSSERLTIRTLF